MQAVESQKTDSPLSPPYYIAVGPTCWGAGTTIARAVASAKRSRPYTSRPAPMTLDVYETVREAHVTPWGAIAYPASVPAPRIVQKVEVAAA